MNEAVEERAGGDDGGSGQEAAAIAELVTKHATTGTRRVGDLGPRIPGLRIEISAPRTCIRPRGLRTLGTRACSLFPIP